MRIGVLHSDLTEAVRLSSRMEGAGYAVQAFADGVALEAAVHDTGFDMLLMQWHGNALSGVGLMHRLRGRLAPAPAMILLVADGAPGSIAETADAQLGDPCPPAELLLTVAALAVRRGPIGGLVTGDAQLLFDAAAATVRVRGMPVQLTAKEFALAQLLVRNIGTSLSRARIMTAIWGRDDNSASRTLDAHIAQVRKRLLLRPDHGWRLSSVYGFGYRLDRLDPVTGQASAATP